MTFSTHVTGPSCVRARHAEYGADGCRGTITADDFLRSIPAYLAYLGDEEWVEHRYPQRHSSPRGTTPMIVTVKLSSSAKSCDHKEMHARAVPIERGGGCGGGLLAVRAANEHGARVRLQAYRVGMSECHFTRSRAGGAR